MTRFFCISHFSQSKLTLSMLKVHPVVTFSLDEKVFSRNKKCMAEIQQDHQPGHNCLCFILINIFYLKSSYYSLACTQAPIIYSLLFVIFDKDEDEEDDFYEAANVLPVRDRGVTLGIQGLDRDLRIFHFYSFLFSGR